MSIALIKLQNHSYSIQYHNKHLHSIKNPRREAERIVRSQLELSKLPERVSDKRSPVFFLLNPGLGYAAEILRQYYPHSVIWAVYSDKTLLEFIRNCAESILKPSEIISAVKPSYFRNYISSILTGFSTFSAQLIDWLPAAHVPGHRQLLTDYRSAMREIQGGLLSHMYFGRRWMKNVALNVRRTGGMRRLKSLAGPVILCAAGPSLHDRMSLIRKMRSRVHVWALPSSVRALLAGGISPDCIVSSDGGYWADLHLRYVPAESHIIMALSSWVSAGLFQNWGSREFISLKMPFMRGSHEDVFMELPERASVLFTALDILARIHRGPLILFGADFTSRGLESHVRPHGFDEFIESRGCRLRPLCTERFERVSGGQLGIYAEWFKTRGYANPGLYRWGDGDELPIPALRSEGDLNRVLAAAPKPGMEWKSAGAAFSEDSVFLDIPRPLPGDLFSNPEHSQLFEALICGNGIELKNQYLRWLGGEGEGLCVQEFENDFIFSRGSEGRRGGA